MATGANQKRIPITIAAGAALSNAALIGDHVMVGIQMPAAWTAAALTFQVSDDGGTTWVNLSDDTGTEVKLSGTGAAGARIAILNLAPFIGITAIKIRSGTAATPVNQAALSQMFVITRCAEELPLLASGTGVVAGSGTGDLTGTGTANYLPMFTGSKTLAISPVYATGGNVGVGTTTPTRPLEVRLQAAGTSDAAIYACSDKVTGGADGVGIKAEATGVGSNLNAGGVFSAGGAAVNNLGVRITGPAAGSGSAGGDWALYCEAPTPVYFAGKVGIGTSFPACPLDVVGGNVRIQNLPSAAPAAGSKQLWYDPADGNRVKFAP